MKLDWRHGILYATVMGMEGCALYIILLLLNIQVAEGRLSVAGLLLLYPLSFVFNLLLRRIRLPRVFGYAVNALAWGMGALLMVKIQLFSILSLFDNTWLLVIQQAITNIFQRFGPELLILFGSAVIWWLGRRLAGVRIDFSASVSEFQFGLAAILIILFAATQLTVELADSITLILAFSLSALLSMAIAHAQESTSWLAGLNQGHWVGLLLVSTGIIIILGLLISSVITQDLLQIILDALKWVWSQIVKVIFFLIDLLPVSEAPEPVPEMPLPGIDADKAAAEAYREIIPKAVRDGLRIGWTIFMTGFMLVALWRVSSQIFGWLRNKLANRTGGEVEPLKGALKADILNLLRRILLMLLGVKLTIRRKIEAGLHGISPVRQIYCHLLQWTADHGWPRPAFQTPYEYLDTLMELLPESGDDLRFITAEYVSTRYGMQTPSEEGLYRLKQSWHQVKQNRLKSPHKHKEDDNPEQV